MADSFTGTESTERKVSDDTPIGAAEPRPVATPATVESDPNIFTHYVWLADGRILRANMTEHTDSLGSRYYETHGEGEDAVETSVPIVGVYAR